MIYVDPAVFCRPNGRKFYGHMVGTTVEELKEFAERIGVKRHFWHAQGPLSHFDINADQRLVALQNGAMEVSSKELAGLARLMNGDLT